jgi:hypothetical protein
VESDVDWAALRYNIQQGGRGDHKTRESEIAGGVAGLLHEFPDNAALIGCYDATASRIWDFVYAQGRGRRVLSVHLHHTSQVNAVQDIGVKYPKTIV